MEQSKLNYKRLQIGPIWLRTVIEIVLIITAIVVCSYLTIRSYENTFYEATKDSAIESTQQLSHCVIGAVDTDLLDIEDPSRMEYAKKYYTDLLNDSFTEGSILNSCAIYTVSQSDVVLFAATDGHGQLGEKQIADMITSVQTGQSASFDYDEVYYTYTPIFRTNETVPCAMLVVSSQYMNSFDYNSVVMERLTTISIVSGIMIIVYYGISGAVSAYKKRKAVSVG